MIINNDFDTLGKCLEYLNSEKFENDVNNILYHNDYLYIDTKKIKITFDNNLYSCNRTMYSQNHNNFTKKGFIAMFRKNFYNLYKNINENIFDYNSNFLTIGSLKTGYMSLNLLEESMIVKIISIDENKTQKFFRGDFIEYIPIEMITESLSKEIIRLFAVDIKTTHQLKLFQKIFNYSDVIIPEKLPPQIHFKTKDLNFEGLNSETFDEYMRKMSGSLYNISTLLENESIDFSRYKFVLTSLNRASNSFDALLKFDKVIIDDLNSGTTKAFLYSLSRDQISNKILVSSNFANKFNIDSQNIKNIFKNNISEDMIFNIGQNRKVFL